MKRSLLVGTMLSTVVFLHPAVAPARDDGGLRVAQAPQQAPAPESERDKDKKQPPGAQRPDRQQRPQQQQQQQVPGAQPQQRVQQPPAAQPPGQPRPQQAQPQVPERAQPPQRPTAQQPPERAPAPQQQQAQPPASAQPPEQRRPPTAQDQQRRPDQQQRPTAQQPAPPPVPPTAQQPRPAQPSTAQQPTPQPPTAQQPRPGQAPTAQQPGPAHPPTAQQPTQQAPTARQPSAAPQPPTAQQPTPQQPSTAQQPAMTPQQPTAQQPPPPGAPQQTARPTGPAPATPPAPSALQALQPQAPATAQQPGQPGQAAPAFNRTGRIDDIRRERREVREDGRNIIQESGRVIIQEAGRAIIRHNEIERFRVDARDVRVERRGGETVTVIDRPDGSRVVTVTDEYGRLVRRSRRGPDGREFVLIDNRYRGPAVVGSYYVDLPPPVIRIPRERYIVEAERARPEEIYAALIAPPVERIDRRYTLDEVRYSPRLLERMPRVDIDTVNFDSGSWQLTPDQIGRLAVIADGIRRAIGANPGEVFLIQGHTDAVGADVDNLSLSDRRAESVAVALSEQFQIPAENLTTQGYGEQYLKVQTDGPERLNRRVTVQRITPLLSGGEGQQGQPG